MNDQFKGDETYKCSGLCAEKIVSDPDGRRPLGGLRNRWESIQIIIG